MMLRLGGVVVLACLGVLLPTRAHAGCLNVCEATVDVAATSPPLSCLSVQAHAQTCDCGMHVTLTNNCADPVLPVGFSFSNCLRGSTGLGACTPLEPGVVGVIRTQVSERAGPGRHARQLVVQHAGSTHTIDLALTVTSFGSGGCSVGRSGGGGFGGVGFFLLVLCLRRGQPLVLRGRISRPFGSVSRTDS